MHVSADKYAFSGPNPMHATSPKERRELLLDLIGRGHGTSQQSLVDALAEHGVDVTQATLSRDLRGLGAVKGQGGYSVPGQAVDPLGKAMGEWLVSATPAQNMIVLRTPPGGASPLAVVLDREAPAEVLGTIAGDDTIFVVTPDPGSAQGLAHRFMRFVPGGKP